MSTIAAGEGRDKGASARIVRALRRLHLGPRHWRQAWLRLVRTVEHPAILATTREDAALSVNYAFMVTVSAGIATIGLLVNSPAVIIGAMLISPLMGPIVASGFAVAGIDVALGRSAARTLLIGAGVAVAFAAGISALSPVQELTGEILARTRPNLFDLAVAILSGAAGGYALIRGRGGAIVGVAIATALMPPLAVVGYGLATLQWPVARGALLLFVTNMAAISLSVAAIALWYGFGRGDLRQRFAMQALVSLVVLAPLAVPLSISLRSIAWESRVQSVARSLLAAGAASLPQGQLAQAQIRFPTDQPPLVEAIVVSQRPRAGLSATLAAELQRALGAPVSLHLTQLQADDPEAAKVAIKEAAVAPPAPPAGVDLAAVLRSEMPFPLAAVDVDPTGRTAVIVPQARAGISLDAWREIEADLARRHAGRQLELIPPPVGLPAIEFAPSSATLDAAAEERLRVVDWALQRWGARNVQLTGHASSDGGGPLALAQQRVAAVAAWLTAHGVDARGQAFYPVPRQQALERELGQPALRSVEIDLLPAPAAPVSSASAALR